MTTFTEKDLSVDQAEVYSAMMYWAAGRLSDVDRNLLKVGGLGGTGKTTLLGVFARNTKLKVAYVTFTGRAASILQRKLKAAGVETTAKYKQTQSEYDRAGGETAWSYAPSSPEGKLPFCGTIHRLLYKPVINAKQELIGWRKRETLDRKYDLLIIDEASMVGGEMLEDLQVHNTPILAVGDHGQLPPVGDSSDLMKNPDYRLEKIHRQAEGNPIIKLAHDIRNGEWLPMKGERVKAQDDRVRFARQTEFEARFKSALNDVTSALGVGALCWTNRTRVRLNSMARSAIGIKGTPREGEVVICLRNKPPIYNGMRGILTTDLQRHASRGWWLIGRAEFPEEGIGATEYTMCSSQFFREKTFGSTDELREARIPVETMEMAGDLYDFGYAMTAHKAQGSQFQHAIVYLDMRESPGSEEYRRWMYTAVTRASERLTILR